MKNVFFLVLMVIPFISFAQKEGPIKFSKDFKVTKGEPYKTIDAAFKLYLSKGDKMVNFIRDKDDIYLRLFDTKSLKLIGEKKFKDFEKGFILEDIITFGGKTYLFYEVWDKKNETEQLFYREINIETGDFKDKGKKLFDVKGRLTGGASLYINGIAANVRDKFSFLESNDNKKLLIKYRKKPDVKNDDKSHDIIGLWCFDSDLNKLSGSDVEMPYTEAKMDILDYTLDNEGTRYILAKVREGNSDKDIKKGQLNYGIELLTIAPNATKAITEKIELDNNFINSLWLFESPNGGIVCAGYYSNNAKSRGDTDGILICKVDEKGKTTDFKTYEIPVSILNQYEKKKDQNKNDKKEQKDEADFDNLSLEKLIINKDGSIIFVGEEQYVKTYVDQQGKTRELYYYNDILVTKIENDGELAWIKKIPKYQMSGPGAPSFKYLYDDEDKQHYFLYTDKEENIVLSLDEKPKQHIVGRGFLTGCKIDDESGETTKLAILNTTNIEGQNIYKFRIDRLVDINSKAFIFDVYKKKKEDILIKVSLD